MAAGTTAYRWWRGSPERDVLARLRVLLYVAMASLCVSVFVLSEPTAFAGPFRVRHPMFAEMYASYAYGAYAVWDMLSPRLLRVVPTSARRVLDVVCMNAVLALVVAEIGLRITALFWATPILVTDASPSRIRRDAERQPPGELRFSFPVNEGGHYDTDFKARSESSGPIVASIGDSFSYGTVPHPYHFTTVWEREHPGVEVYNMGYPGTGPSDYLYLLDQEALSLNPDLLVIQLFVGNDVTAGPGVVDPPRVYDADRYLAAVVWHRIQLLRRARMVARSAVAVQATRTREGLLSQYPWLDDPFLEKPNLSRENFMTLESRNSWAIGLDHRGVYERLFQELEALERAAGDVPLAFVLIPDEFQVEDDLWEEVLQRTDEPLERDRPQRQIVPWLEARGLPVLDLLPIMRAVEPLEDGRRHVYHLQDTHFNARGNEVAGRAMAGFARSLLPASLPFQLAFTEGEPPGWMRNGWHRVESSSDQSWVWSDGTSSVLDVRLPTDGDVVLHLDCGPFSYPGVPEQRVAVVVNDTVVEEVVLSSGRDTYAVTLPASSLVEGLNRVEFRYAYAVIPRDVLGGAQDNRRIGVVWYGINFLTDGPQALTYRGRASERHTLQGGFTVRQVVSGPEAIVKEVKDAGGLLSLQEINVRGEGERVVTMASDQTLAVRLEFDRAEVDGTFSGQPFRFDFDRASLESQVDPQRLAWQLGMGGRRFTLGVRGEYTMTGPDAAAEAVGLVIDAPVRLPERAVSVGDEWAVEWTGTQRPAEVDGALRLRQVARLKEIVPFPSPRARIEFETTGDLVITATPNVSRGDSMTLAATGSVLLDLLTGQIVAIDTSGTITSAFSAAGFTRVLEVAAQFNLR